MYKVFKELIGYEGSVIDLSNEIYQLGEKAGATVDDICDYGNWEELLEDGNVVVSLDEIGVESMQIFFDVLSYDDEIIKITKIEEF